MSTVEQIIVQTNRDLLTAIQAQPDAMKAVLQHLRAQITLPSLRELLAEADSVFITGCGDSFFAGMATQQAFLQHARIFTQAVEAMEYSRYQGLYAPRNSLLIAVSNSGRVSRTIEAAHSGRRRLGTIAVTDSPDSDLARVATLTVSVGLPPMSSGGTGTHTYLASLLALYVLAITLGEVRGTLSAKEAADLHRILDRGTEAVTWTLEHSHGPVRRVVSLSCSEHILYVLGAGPNYGTAYYGAAKLLEAVAVSGVPVQLEEWAHGQFHISGPDTTYVVLAPSGSGRDRVLEQLDGLRAMQANLIVVGPEGDTEPGASTPHVIPVSGRLPEEFSPLEMCVPLQLLAVELAMARHVAMRMRIDEHKRDVNFRQIFHSSIAVPSEHSVSNLDI